MNLNRFKKRVYVILGILIFSIIVVQYIRSIPFRCYTSADIYRLFPEQLARLKDKAEKGDGQAAYLMFRYYSYDLSDEKNGEPWLRRAAELKNTGAERVLAAGIKNGQYSPGSFGKTAPEAFCNLLEQASYTNGQACHELASAYADGYLSPSDFAKARFYYSRGAEFGDRMCWEKLSEYYHKGLGGNRDEVSAYYWISLETRCVHPDSGSGKESWALREEIAEVLSIAELRTQWAKIDQYISQVRAGKISVYLIPFGKGIYQTSDPKKGEKLSDEREVQHRQRMERRQ